MYSLGFKGATSAPLLVGRRQRRQAQLDLPQAGHVVLHDQRQVVLQVHLNLAAQVGALDEVAQIFQREFALNDFIGVLFLNELHAAVGFHAPDLRRGKLAGAPEDELVAHRLDLQLLRNARHVANNFLDIGGRQVDDRRKHHVGLNELFGVGLNEPQLLRLALPNVAVLKLQAQERHNAVVVVLLLNVQRERVVVVYGVNQLEQVEHVDANNDFFHVTLVVLKILRAQEQVRQHGVRLVHVHDADAVLLKRDVGFQQDVLERRHERAKRRDLHGLDGQHVVGISRCVHFPKCYVRIPQFK